MSEAPVEAESLEQRIARWTPKELDEFYKDVDIDLHASVHEQDAHWLCRTPLIKRKNKRTGEMTPMYRVLGRQVSRQRITLILENQEDPVQMSRIRARCGVEFCINPYHLSVKHRARKRSHVAPLEQ